MSQEQANASRCKTTVLGFVTRWPRGVSLAVLPVTRFLVFRGAGSEIQYAAGGAAPCITQGLATAARSSAMLTTRRTSARPRFPGVAWLLVLVADRGDLLDSGPNAT